MDSTSGEVFDVVKGGGAPAPLELGARGAHAPERPLHRPLHSLIPARDLALAEDDLGAHLRAQPRDDVLWLAGPDGEARSERPELFLRAARPPA